MTQTKKTKKQLLEELEELKDKVYLYEKNAKEHDYEQNRLYHLATFPELNPNPIIEIDEAKTITYCNDASLEIFKKLNIEQDLYLFFPDDIDIMIKELCNGKDYSYVREKIINNRIFEEHIYLTSKIKTIRIYILDVTEIKTSENELLKTKQLLEKITKTSPAIISVFDVKTEQNIYQNRSLLFTLGYSEEDVKEIINNSSSNILQSIHQDDIPVVEQFYESMNSIQDGENYEMEFRIRDKYNKWQWIRRVYSVFSRDENGVPSQLVSIFENINARKNAEEKLKESEASLLQAQTIAKLGHFEYDIKTRKSKWSPETFKITGCEHLTEAPTFEEYEKCIHPDDVELLRSTNFNSIRENKPFNYKYRILKKDGNITFIHSIGRPLCDKTGNVIKIFGTIIDITDSVKANENNRINAERFRVALHNSPIIVFNQDTDLKYTWIYNPAGGINAGEIIGKTDHELVPANEAEELTKIKREVITTGKGINTEIWLHIANKHLCFDLTVEPLFNIKNEITGITCSTIDISERKKYELKLKENEAKFRGIFENANDIIVYVDKYGNIIEVNKKIENILGYKREELIGKNFLSLKIFTPEIFSKLTEGFKSALSGDTIKKGKNEKDYNTFDLEVRKKDNSIAIIEANTTLIKENNNVQGFLSIIRDITEERAYLTALRESEETSSALLNTISETVIMHDINGVLLTLNDTAAKRLGITKSELIGKNVYKLFPENLAKLRFEKTKSVVKSKKPVRFYDSRNDLFFDTTIYPVFDQSGKVNKLIIFAKDITEAKIAEEKIKESEERYRNLIESSPEAIIVHCEGKIIFANEATAELVKAEKAEDILGKEVLKFLHPDYKPDVAKRIEEITVRRKRVPVLEEKFICLDGSEIDVEVSAIPITVGGKNAVQVIAHDITEKKKVLNFLRESEIKHKTLFESANDAIFLLKDNLFIDCNTKALKMFDCSREDIIGKAPFDYSPQFQPDGSNSKDKAIDVINKAYDGEALFFEWRHIKKDGTLFDVEVSLNRIELGGIPYIQKIVRDITERKQSEKALYEAKLLLEKIAATSPTIITVYDINTAKNIYQNKSLLESLGYGNDVFRKYKEQKLSRNDIIHKDDFNILDDEYQKISELKDGESYSIEYRIKDASDKWNWIRKVYSVFQRNGSGQPEQIISIFENITKRKESEIALKLSEEFNRAINENSPLGISVRDKYGKLITCNNEWKKILEKTEEDVEEDKSRHREELIFDEKDKYLEPWQEDLKKIYTSGGTLYIPELKIITNKEHKLKWISYYFYAIKNMEGNVDRVVIITEEITERKKAEEAYNESQRKLATLMNNLPGMAYRCKNDKSWTMEFVSERCYELTGFRTNELINNKVTSFSSLVHKDDMEMVRLEVQKAMDKKEGYEIIYRIITADKKEKWVWEKGEGIYDEKNKLIAFEGFVTDISERKKTEEQLRKLYKGLQQSPASIIITDLKGDIEYVNPSFTKTTGYTAEEVYGTNPRLLKSGYTEQEEYKKMWETISQGNEWKGEFHNKKKSGELFWETASLSPIKDESGNITHFLAVKEDITEQKIKDEKLKSSLKEKEVMLREIHHRVKNNLQIISSLLKLQSGYIKDPVSYDFFTISQNRVKSMALIHQQLYRSTDLSKIDFGDYIKKLAHHLSAAYGINSEQVNFKIKAKDIYLGIDTAIPCGLLINELISNALKHAFPSNRKGNISISLFPDDTNRFNLIINDDGVGLPDDFNYRETTSLGMQLVVTLTEQLDGSIEVSSKNGTEFHIKFSNPVYIKRE